MKQKIKAMLGLVSLALVLVPMIQVKALETKEVTNEAELVAAVNDANVGTIVLKNNIETTAKVNITNPKIIDGQGFSISYIGKFVGGSTDNTIWGAESDAKGVYILQVYKTTATIKNIKLTGGNAALLVNGSTVTLEGNVDLSGNGFGAIELSKGVNVDTPSLLTIENANLINTTESNSTPTFWTDGYTIDDIKNGLVEIYGNEDQIGGAVLVNNNGQFQFFTEKANVPTGPDYTEIPLEPTPTPTPTPSPTPTATPKPTTPPATGNDSETITENPNTYDGITAYLVMGMMSLGALGFSTNKLYRQAKMSK